jgi:hypothetical protein
MTRFVLLAAVFAFLAALTAKAYGAEPKKLVLERTSLKDPTSQTTACTFLKPKGWEVDGKIDWVPSMVHQANLGIKISNPKGTERYRTLPMAVFLNITNYPIQLNRFDLLYSGLYCETMSPNDLFKAAFDKFGLDGKTDGVRFVETTELPDVAKQYAKATGLNTVEAGKTRLQYDENGTTYEEDFYFVYGYVSTRISGNTMTQFFPLIHCFGIRAEKGELNAATPRLLSIAHSMQTTREFELVRAEGLANLMNTFYNRIAEIDRISKQISANNDSMIAMIRSDRESRWAAESKASKKFSDYILGVEGYTDGKSLYTVPSGYSNVWSDGNGTVILSNESGYDPNQTESGTWKTLKQAK